MKDDGQMMLLAGVLLVIGFIALAGLVSTAQRLGEVTLQDEGRIAINEMQSVAAAVEDIIDHLDANIAPAPGSSAFNAEMNRTLEHLQTLENRRGFRFDFQVDDGCSGSTWGVVFTVADSQTRLALRSADRAC